MPQLFNGIDMDTLPAYYADSVFESAYGTSRNTFNVMAVCSHIRTPLTRTAPVDGICACFTAALTDGSEYIGTAAHLIYYITLAFLIVQWTHSMQYELDKSAKAARVIAYVLIGLTILEATSSVVLYICFQQGLFGDTEVFVLASTITYGCNTGIIILICLDAIWMLAMCPKESKVSGSNKKRWHLAHLIHFMAVLGRVPTIYIHRVCSMLPFHHSHYHHLSSPSDIHVSNAMILSVTVIAITLAASQYALFALLVFITMSDSANASPVALFGAKPRSLQARVPLGDPLVCDLPPEQHKTKSRICLLYHSHTGDACNNKRHICISGNACVIPSDSTEGTCQYIP
ncbi:hypothetical protein THASP1DRAFT_22468 [Thamnocephalis sphaerospora]|uniref:Uncharacterized protein n=1 Tax=Thamnocephalis sphaerospora TaxID=78915 RepID=A0A4P9XU51_9FUNG|nr:hypothetical protein THASP1DRAFT_22468 [Thamnocephalis sphaerospora]|eukprot:RKP09716.1 hypothetical protein THASP1DRAFT_22468 [Thamnocephalis sphaerospora]